MTLYYLKIIEGFSMEVHFDDVQGLNLFHKKTQSLIDTINGVVLHEQTIRVKRTLDVIPLLYLKDAAPFMLYKPILFNHIQSIINFYALRNWDPVLCPDSNTTTCGFEGGRDKLNIDDFLDSRKTTRYKTFKNNYPYEQAYITPKLLIYFGIDFPNLPCGETTCNYKAYYMIVTVV